MTETRRNFIKQSCIACICMTAIGSAFVSCVSSKSLYKSSIENNTLLVPKEKFINSNYVIVRNSNIQSDILLLQDKSEYKAIQMLCTHNNYALNYTGKNLVCNAHGSVFDTDGRVLREPATQALNTYRTSQDEQHIIIHLV